jgi:hypothetical protein
LPNLTHFRDGVYGWAGIISFRSLKNCLESGCESPAQPVRSIAMS